MGIRISFNLTVKVRGAWAGRRPRPEHGERGDSGEPSTVLKSGGSDASIRGGRVAGGAGGDPEAEGGGERGSGKHLPQEIGLEAFEFWMVLCVATSTRLKARGFGGSWDHGCLNNRTEEHIVCNNIVV